MMEEHIQQALQIQGNRHICQYNHKIEMSLQYGTSEVISSVFPFQYLICMHA